MKEEKKVYPMGTGPKHAVSADSRHGIRITSLDKLTEMVGGKMTDCLFVEYFMRLVAKSERLDAISKAVDDGADIFEIKEILNGTDGNHTDKDSFIV